MKRDEYRYWARRPAHERLAAGAELSRQAYVMKGEDVQSFVELLSALNAKPVRYLIVGGTR